MYLNKKYKYGKKGLEKIPILHKSIESQNGYILMKNINFSAKTIMWD